MKHALHSFFVRISNVRLNAEIQRVFASGLRTHINAELPEWIQLAPYGEWPTSEKNADGTPEAVQVFGKDDAEALVKRFNAWHRRLSRLARINSCKVYVGHPDFAPDIWPKRQELGDVLELSADDKGLNGRMRWNSDAQALLKKNPFPSVAWDTEDQSEGRERPVMLWSVGMTSRPNIKGVKSAINACAEPEAELETENQTEPPMIKKIKDALCGAGLCNADDPDEVIQTHVGQMIANIGQQKQWAAQEKARADKMKTALNCDVTDVDSGIETALARINALNGEKTSLETRVNALTSERDEARKARCNAILDRLVESGRITKAEADAQGDDALSTRLNAEPDKVLAEMLQKPCRLNNQGLNLGRSKEAIMDASERRSRINTWTDDYMVKNKVGYDDAYKAAQACPELKPLFDAMKQPES
ncbi:phage protease [Prosthecobacter vanneervenii]|uniref:Phage I-like protein n=1 Tax=Prosthecobacter vanneervenii TaxID=48466 RepID=A0A7W7YBK5_9BACT|nr:phage protease [Prosthecobacter vanneervenii]MBB5033163.1 phage I-like protein [Prosthecobacter vanneervenii]